MSGSLRNSLLRDERLLAVYELLGECDTVADVGSDHGYLSAALAVSGRAKRVIASDISPASQRKAAQLAVSLGVEDVMSAVVSDGLDCLEGVEPPFALAICGMGGELIADILERRSDIAKKASRIVMQPMRGEAELREYLYSHSYRIADEKVVLDSGRFYQLIAAVPNEEDEIPEGFPKGWFRFGWVMAEKRDPVLLKLLRHYREVYQKELEKAEKRGKTPESLTGEIERTDRLIRFMTGEEEGKPVTLSDFITAMESIAPRDTALEFDNPGLIVGTRKTEIRRVLVALDCTVPVVREAKEKGCDLVLTHHPLLFRAVKHITPEDPATAAVFELIESGIAMFAAHTNLDMAEGGVNTALCRALGIENEVPVPPENLCRVGELERELPFSEFAKRVETALDTKVRLAGPERPVRRIMVCGGSGGSEYPYAAGVGADVLVTGECKHSEAIEAVQCGVNVLVGGHYETEAVVLKPLIARLCELTRGVEYLLSESKTPLYTLS